MKLNRTPNPLDRNARNDENDNWDIIEGEVRKVGDIARGVDGKANQALKLANQANEKSNIANSKADDTQQQLDDIILDDGTGNAEVIQARGGEPLLKDRLNKTDAQLAETDSFRGKESMINRKTRKPIITWIDDDGREGVYTKLKPLAKEYGITFTSALITKRLENPTSNSLTINQIKELQDLGFEFLSHTHNHDPNHRPTAMTEEELHEDFSTSKELMRKYGLNDRGLVIPFSYSGWDQRVGRISREYFDYAIGTGATGPSQDDSGEANIPPLNNYYIRRTTIERGADIVKRQIDKAVAENGWVVIVSHVDNTGSNEWWDESIAREVIEYAQNKGVEFVTTEEGINRFGNIAQFGASRPYMDIADEIRHGRGTVIDADGVIHSYDMGRYRILPKNSISVDDGAEVFPNNTISSCEITSNNAGDYPRGRSGVLWTYKGSEGAYHYQNYVTTRDKRYFSRYWDNSNSKWSDWVLESPIQSLDTNGMKSSDDPTVGLTNRITYTYIDSTNTNGFPENKRGWLINQALLSSSVYQYYHIADSFNVYKRNFVNGSFSDWKLVEGNLAAINLGVGEVSLQTPPSYFQEGISVFYMPGNIQDEAKPNGDTGLVTTYKSTSSGNDRCYQEFKSYGKEDKFIRYATSGIAWSAWKKFVLE